MFLSGVVELCSAALIFVFLMLWIAKRRKAGKKASEVLEETGALLITTLFFGGGISLFVSFHVQDTSVVEYAVAAALAITTVFIIKLLKVRTRLAHYEVDSDKGALINGNFSKAGSPNSSEKPLRKAA